MNLCPNLSNKKVKARFEELVETFGEDIAYFLWDKNNGYDLESAPDGSTSEVYQQALILNGGDRRLALIDTASDLVQRTNVGISNDFALQNTRLWGLSSDDYIYSAETLNAVLSMAEVLGVGIREVRFDKEDALAAADFFNKSIKITENYKDRALAWDKLPEEVAHWWYKLLSADTQLKKDLWEAAKTSDKYKDLIEKDYGDYSLFANADDLFIEEALGQLIAEEIHNILTKLEKAKNRSNLKKLFNRLWNRFLKVIGKYKEHINTPIEEAAERILKSDVSDLINIDEYWNNEFGYLAKEWDGMITPQLLDFINKMIEKVSKYSKKDKERIAKYLSSTLAITKRTQKAADYETTIQLATIDEFKRKFKNGIPLSSEIKVDGKKIEVKIYNDVLLFIKNNIDQYKYKKSIPLLDFLAYLNEFLKDNYLLTFAQLNRWTDYKIDLTFIDTTAKHRKLGVFFNRTVRTVGGSHFGENEFGFGSMTYFSTKGKGKTKDAVMIHEIQSDVFEILDLILNSKNKNWLSVLCKEFSLYTPKTLANVIRLIYDIRHALISISGLPKNSTPYLIVAYELRTLKNETRLLTPAKEKNAKDILNRERLKKITLNKTIDLCKKIKDEYFNRYGHSVRNVSLANIASNFPGVFANVMDPVKSKKYIDDLLLKLNYIDNLYDENERALYLSSITKSGKNLTEHLIWYKIFKTLKKNQENTILYQLRMLRRHYSIKNKLNFLLQIYDLGEEGVQHLYDSVMDILYKATKDIAANKNVKPITLNEDFVRAYAPIIIHHLIQTIIREKGKDFPIYFPSYLATMLLLGDMGTALIYATKEEAEQIYQKNLLEPFTVFDKHMTGYESSSVHKLFPAGKRLSIPADLREDKDTQDFIKKYKFVELEDEPGVYVRKPNAGTLHLIMKHLKGVKLIPVDKIPGLVGNVSVEEKMEDSQEYANKIRPYFEYAKTQVDDDHYALLIAAQMLEGDTIAPPLPFESPSHEDLENFNLLNLFGYSRIIVDLQRNTPSVGGFLLDLSNYSYTQPLLYGLKDSSKTDLEQVSDDAYNPNQIKSATDNNGEFSTEDDNIYHNLRTDYETRKANFIRLAMDRGLLSRRLGSYDYDARYGERWYMTYTKGRGFSEEDGFYLKYKKESDFNNEVALLRDLGLKHGIHVLHYPKAKYIYIKDDFDYEVDDEHRMDTSINREEIEFISTMMLRLIPGIKVKIISQRSAARYDGYRKGATAWIKNDTVYIIQELATAEATFEEFLHPIVLSLQIDNNALFELLLAEAKADSRFHKVIKKIEAVYRDDAGFSQDVRDNEIVTHALSYYMSRINSRSITDRIRRLVDDIMLWFYTKMTGAIHPDGDKFAILLKNLQNLTIKDLALLLSKDDVYIKDPKFNAKEAQYNLAEELLILQERIQKQFEKLHKYYISHGNKQGVSEVHASQIWDTIQKLKGAELLVSYEHAIVSGLAALGYEDQNGDILEGTILKRLLDSEVLPEPFSDITPEELMRMRKEFIGFYDIIKDIVPTVGQHVITDPSVLDMYHVLSDSVSTCKELWKKALYYTTKRFVEDYIDSHVIESDENIEEMKLVYTDAALLKAFSGDISWIETFFGNYGLSTPIIKMGFHIIQEANQKTNTAFSTRMHEVYSSKRRVNPFKRKINSAWELIMMEIDPVTNLPTGKFIRPLNYGLYEREYNEFVQQLHEDFTKSHGHAYVLENGIWINDVTGQPASEEEWSDFAPPDFIEYRFELEMWKCKHSERPYTYEYYHEMYSRPFSSEYPDGHGLSPRTIIELERINKQILFYRKKGIDRKTGEFHIYNLQKPFREKLRALQELKRDMGNPYNEDGTLKDGDAYNMAMEIASWNNYKSKELFRNIDLNAMYDELDEIRKRIANGEDPLLEKDFMEDQGSYGLHPDFMTLLFGDATNQDGIARKYKLLMAGMSKLIAMPKMDQNGNIVDWVDKDVSKFEDSLPVLLLYKMLQQMLEDEKTGGSGRNVSDYIYTQEVLYKDLNGMCINKRTGATEHPSKIFGIDYADYITYSEHLQKKYAAIAYRDKKIDGILDENGVDIKDFTGMTEKQCGEWIRDNVLTYEKVWYNKHGNLNISREPIGLLSIMMPKSSTFYNPNTGTTEPTLIFTPGENFSHYTNYKTVGDEDSGYFAIDSRFINAKYDSNNPEYEQPSSDYYDNSENYRKMRKLCGRHYDVLIDVMKEGWEQYSSGSDFRYNLPQINASDFALISRIFSRGFKETAKSIKNSWVNVRENDTDMRVYELAIQNPDGDSQLDIPRRFIEKLKDPSEISKDISGATLLFLLYALDYKNKSDVEGDLYALRQSLSNEFDQPSNALEGSLAKNDIPKNEVKKFNTMLSKHFYSDRYSTKEKASKPDKKPTSWLALAGQNILNTAAIFGLLWWLSPSMATILSVGSAVLTFCALGFNSVTALKFNRLILRSQTVMLLGLNFASFMAGFVTSILTLWKEAISGKYFGFAEWIKSLGELCIKLPVTLWNVGAKGAFSKGVALMNRFGISNSSDTAARNSNRGRLKSILSKVVMGGFSTVDNFANSILTKSILRSYKFYEGDSEIPAGFYNWPLLRTLFLTHGRTSRSAFAKRCFATSLYTVYKFVPIDGDNYFEKHLFGGKIEIDPLYKKYVTNELETTVGTTIQLRAGLINGMNPDNDVPEYRDTTVGAAAGSMRGYLGQNILHMYNNRNEFYYPRTYSEESVEIQRGIPKKKKKQYLRLEPDRVRNHANMSWNFETGTVNDNILPNLYSGFSNTVKGFFTLIGSLFSSNMRKKLKDRKLSYPEAYAIRQSLSFVFVTGMLCLLIVGVTNPKALLVPAPKNREQAAMATSVQEFRDKLVFWPLANNILIRSAGQLGTNIDIGTIGEVVQNSTVWISSMRDLLNLATYGTSALDDGGLDKYNEIINRGAYRYYTKKERVLMKGFGLPDNLHTALSTLHLKSNSEFTVKHSATIWPVWNKFANTVGLPPLTGYSGVDKKSKSLASKLKGVKNKSKGRVGGKGRIGGKGRVGGKGRGNSRGRV